MDLHLSLERWHLAVLAVLVAALLGGVAYAAIPDSAGVYTACKLNATGTIRLIDPSLGSSNLLGHCTALESQITWNKTGQAGANGVSPTVVQLTAGDSHCPAGGASITDSTGNAAYVCNGRSFTGSFQSPSGQYGLEVSDQGVTLSGPGESLVMAGGDVTESVGGNEAITVGGSRTESVGKDQSLTIARNQNVEVGGSRTENVAQNETVTVSGDRSHTVGGNDTVSVGKDRSETVSGNETVTVASNRSETVGGDESVHVSGNKTEKDDGNYLHQASGNFTLKADINGLIESGAVLTLKASLINQN